MPLLSVQKARAQSATATATGMIASIATTIAVMPGCKALRTSIKDLFKSKKKKEQETEDKKKAEEKAEKTASLEEEGTEAGAAAESVQVIAPVTDATLEQHGKKLDIIDSNIEDVKESTGSINKNQTCFNAIGKIVVKMLIKKLTMSIVNWINGTSKGGPLFVTNPEKFFKDIYKEELLGFGLEINDPNKFPFGKAFMANQALLFQQHFADNAQYSLNQMIAQANPDCTDKNGKRVSCDIAFGADFSQGGWGAWDALTQVPYNNPLGFQLAASNELQKRLEGTSQSTAQNLRDSLKEAGGFLGDLRCSADPEGITQEKKRAALVAGQKDPCIEAGGKWEYVTPGAVIANKLETVVNYNDHALLDAETLNDAIAAIIDAAMARFTSELTNKGLTALSENNNNEETSFENIDLGEYFPSGTTTSQTEMDFASSYMTDWLRNNPDFNIRTDITQALIDQQRTYVDKLNSYDDTLNDLIKWIRQLDYCVPGPNPNWERTTLSAIQNLGSPTPATNWWNTETAQIINSFLDPAGVFGVVKGIIDADAAKKAAAAYIEHILDVHISRDQDQITDSAGIMALFGSIFESYRGVINSIYFTLTSPDYDKYMPGVTMEARAQFQKITGYEQIIGNNVKEISYRKGIINRLIGLKQKIDGLNSDLANGAVKDTSGNIAVDQQTQYEENFKPTSTIITEFARLSGYFVSGNDIAKIDNLYKQALDEKTYVKDNLLGNRKTIGSCEYDMYNLWKTDPSTYSTYARRQVYPYPIDHLYAWFGLDKPESAGGGGPYNVSYNDPTVDIKAMLKPRFLGGTDGNDGFLFGTFYYNAHAAPSWSCSDSSVKYIGTPVSLSMKNGDGDIGGIGAGGNEGGEYKNNCGVITRGFEKVFNVY